MLEYKLKSYESTLEYSWQLQNVIRLLPSPGGHINSTLFVEVDAAVATVHLMVCGCSVCCSVGGVCAWDAWLPATAPLAAGVFAVAADLPFRAVPRRMFRHDHCQYIGETDVAYLTINGSREEIRR